MLVEIVNMVNSDTTVDELYEVMLEGIIKIIPNSNTGCILRLDYDNNLYIEKSIGYDDEYARNFKIPFLDSFAYSFLDGNYRRSVSVKNLQEDYRDAFPEIVSTTRGFRLESNMTSPINIEGKLYGLISIDGYDKDGFDEVDLNLIEFLRGKIEMAINRHNELIKKIEKSHLDELTEIYNRSYFMEIADAHISEAVLHHEELSLVIFDLDGLKAVNDKFGHLAGDKMIRGFARVMLGKIRDVDIVARLGGDEFVGLFRNIEIETLKAKINSIAHELIDSPISYEGINISTKFSFGVAIFPNDGEQINDLIEIADERMYCQKSNKKIEEKNHVYSYL